MDNKGLKQMIINKYTIEPTCGYSTLDNEHQWVVWYPKDNPEPWYIFTAPERTMRSYRFPAEPGGCTF